MSKRMGELTGSEQGTLEGSRRGPLVERHVPSARPRLDVGPDYMSECWPTTLGVGDMTVRGSIRETLRENARWGPQWEVGA